MTRSRRSRPTATAAPTASISIPQDNPSRAREKQIRLAAQAERAARKQYEEALAQVGKLDPLNPTYAVAQRTLEAAALLLLDARTTLRQVLAGVDVQVEVETQ